MEGASAEGEAAVPHFDALVASGEAHEAAAPAAEAPAPAKTSAAAGGGGTRPQDVTERSTPRFLRSLHQARAAALLRWPAVRAFCREC
jgi:hypothetical protein